MSQQCKTQADCFEQLARVMRMCEGTGVAHISNCIKQYATVWHRQNGLPNFAFPTQWAFAVAIVEDKPVFIGDTLYHKWFGYITITGVEATGLKFRGNNGGNGTALTVNLSWNPPKPKEPEIPEGYTRHDGGECPVHGSCIVKALLAYGGYIEMTASSLIWFGGQNPIIAYKIIKPATVMVELSVDAASFLAGRFGCTVGEACRKALENDRRREAEARVQQAKAQTAQVWRWLNK